MLAKAPFSLAEDDLTSRLLRLRKGVQRSQSVKKAKKIMGNAVTTSKTKPTMTRGIVVTPARSVKATQTPHAATREKVKMAKTQSDFLSRPMRNASCATNRTSLREVRVSVGPDCHAAQVGLTRSIAALQPAENLCLEQTR